MLDIFAQYATDRDREINGTWQPLNGARFLVARIGNPRHSKLMNKLIEENKDVLDGDDEIAASEKSDEIMSHVFSKTILLGWEGVGYKGEEVPYSQEKAQELLKHTEFRVAIATLASKFEAYKVKQEEEQGKV